MRKKAGPLTRAHTETVSVCFKVGVHGVLTKLIAVRKLRDAKDGFPTSAVGIVDAAVMDFVTYLEAAEDPGFVPVPPRGCVRVSLRVSAKPSKIAQETAAKHDVRLTDFYRTAVTRYLRKHKQEIEIMLNRPRRR